MSPLVSVFVGVVNQQRPSPPGDRFVSTFVREETHKTPESGRSQRGDAGHDSSRGRWWKVGLLAISLVAVMASVTAFIWGAMASRKSGVAMPHTITRGTLVVTVTEQGTLESSKNTEIRCEIRGGYGGRGGRSTVTWVIAPGTIVQQGDELVRLDTKRIEETVSLGKTDLNNEIAQLAQAQADLEKAQVALDGYLEGRFRSKMQELDNLLKVFTRNLLSAQTMLRSSESLFEQGYVTQLEVEGMSYSVRRAELEQNVTKTEIDVLARLTRTMKLETLNGQLTATTARVAGREAGVALEQGRLDLALVELENCVIKAPGDGLVIFPSTAKWKDAPDIDVGASVYNNQVLLLMPDLFQMQVKIGIHESIVDDIKPGLAAKITMPDRTLDTTITSVAALASPAGWWTGNAVNYETIVQLPSVEGLKPGMTVDVDVIVARYDDVLTVPAFAVVDTDEGHFCWVQTGEEVQRRDLKLGASNDQFIVVQSGLMEGDEVVLDPTASVPEARELVGPTLVHTITRGDLPVTLTEQGTLESSDNTKIKCKVRGNSTINWVIESGTKVEAGDELIRLENKQIEEYLHERTKFAHLSRDSAITFRAQATSAGLALSVYREGTYRTELMTLEKDEAIAEANLRSTQNLLGHARLMAKSEYVSELDLEEREFAVRVAKTDLEIWKTKINVLKQFTRDEQLVTLKGNWEAAKAAANGHEEVLTMDEERIALARKEMQRCVIKAERSGIVIYPGSDQWKDAPDITEGATVHNDQVLLLMPDLSRMQVKVGIHESMIDRVRPGMPATVTLHGKTLTGKVSSVASTAQPAGWWTGNMVKYDAIIQLPSAEGLKPGMSAEVEVIMEQHDDVLTIPVAAVEETEEGYFCWVGTAEQAQRRSLQLGDSNSVFVLVEAGLQEGEQVVLNPTAFIEEAQLMSVASHGSTSQRPD
ncbi:MAG TPA: HlyD family efflux transporter periplasmic adaptor subunit [Fuerstia sp.]|nr:HlyD family efflux transporter periplasmic adaptor subunit [Fuerstiella sp.]